MLMHLSLPWEDIKSPIGLRDEVDHNPYPAGECECPVPLEEEWWRWEVIAAAAETPEFKWWWWLEAEFETAPGPVLPPELDEALDDDKGGNL